MNDLNAHFLQRAVVVRNVVDGIQPHDHRIGERTANEVSRRLNQGYADRRIEALDVLGRRSPTESTANDVQITVAFKEGTGVKKLLASFAKLEKTSQ